MNMTVAKSDISASIPSAPTPPAAAKIVPLPLKQTTMNSRIRAGLVRAASAVIPPLVMIVLLLTAWQLLCMRPGATLPPPSKIWTEAYDLIVDPFFVAGPQDIGLGWRVLISLQRVAIGYGLAALFGIALGTLVGQSVWAMRGLDPIFQVLRTVPPLAWLPLSLAGFRDSHPSALFVIFITSIWPIIINTAVGIREIPEDYTNVARVLRLRKGEYIRNVVIPATVPYVFTGLRIAVGLAWLAIVAAEMLKADGGIGYFIWDAYNAGGDSSSSQIILAIVYVGLVGLALDRLVAWVGRRVARGSN